MFFGKKPHHYLAPGLIDVGFEQFFVMLYLQAGNDRIHAAFHFRLMDEPEQRGITISLVHCGAPVRTRTSLWNLRPHKGAIKAGPMVLQVRALPAA